MYVHAEIHSYNINHPRGRKYISKELELHKKQWLKLCTDKPEIFLKASRNRDVGPLNSLMDELEINILVAKKIDDEIIASFRDEQYRRAKREGVISILNEDLKEAIINAYVQIDRINNIIKYIMLKKNYYSFYHRNKYIIFNVKN